MTLYLNISIKNIVWFFGIVDIIHKNYGKSSPFIDIIQINKNNYYFKLS